MKKFFPEHQHASILTQFIAVLSTLFFLFFLNPGQALAACSFNSATRNASGDLVLGVTGLDPNTQYYAKIDKNPLAVGGDKSTISFSTNSSGNATITVDGVTAQSNIQVVIDNSTSRFDVVAECLLTNRSYISVSEAITQITGVAYTKELVNICHYADDPACASCLAEEGIWTALGCIHYNQDEFTIDLVRIIMGVAGFIALAMMLVGTIMFMTGGSNPEQVKRGKELFTGAVIGLLFLIFSVVILQIITQDIIKIDL